MALSKKLSRAVKAAVAAPLLVGAMSASAALIEVEYTGTVNYSYGDGAGYSVGDIISGSLFIDTDLAPADRRASDSRIGDYYSYSDNSDFITGYQPGGGLYDRVYIEDDRYSNRDYFYVIDRDYQSSANGNNRYYHDDYLQLIAYDYSFDFINGIGLDQQFDLSSGDASYFYGNIVNHEYTYQGGRYVRTDYGHSRFSLNNLRVAAADVPAPGSLALVGLGLLGLGAARRRKTTQE